MDIKRVVIYSLVFVGSVVARQAVFIEPFTDLGISKICGENEPFSSLYNGCKRTHQALFNEVCDVLEDKGSVLRIALNNVVYGIKKTDSENMSAFLVPREAVVFLDAADAALFPPPLSLDYFKQMISGTVVVLTSPWRHYSAATRFMRTHKDTDKHYGIIYYDAKRKKKVFARVPKERARAEEAVLNYYDAQKEFVRLLYSWAQLSTGVIPYVWGGSSFIYTQKDNNFYLDEESNFRYKSNIPATGYDCSELILRAAQICGIPYFYKTTAVLAEYMRPLALGEEIVAGDLLWHPGHVMVVGDVSRNEIVESRGYPTGYGKVQVIELNKLFPEIVTYDDLKRKYFAKEPFKLVRKNGSFYKNIDDGFKIFKLSSVWGK